MAAFLLFEDIGNLEEYAGLLDISEFIVDGRAKHSHRRRERHIGVHQRRDILVRLPDK